MHGITDNRPIGVFDSGLGGLTVLRAMRSLMPNESLVYFGDSGRTPYGTKSKEIIIKYTFQDMNFLLRQNVKMIVIACNTASACSLDVVRQQYAFPVVEVVEPGARAASRVTQSGRIGVIGTTATVSSGVYERAITRYLPEAAIQAKACPLFVPLVEEGWWDNDISELVAFRYLQDMKQAEVDTLILGCTHYPLLQAVIGRVMGPQVKLVNSAWEVARAVQEVLQQEQLKAADNHQPSVRFYTSDSEEKFTSLGTLFLGAAMHSATKVEIEKEWDGGACYDRS